MNKELFALVLSLPNPNNQRS